MGVRAQSHSKSIKKKSATNKAIPADRRTPAAERIVCHYFAPIHY